MSEHSEQAVVIEWARLSGLKTLFAIPNGAKLPYKRGANGKRYAPQAYKLLEEGMLPGVSDLFLPVARNGWHGMFIEMKFGKNKVTPEQEAFIEEVQNEGYFVVICYNADDAIANIKAYMGMVPLLEDRVRKLLVVEE